MQNSKTRSFDKMLKKYLMNPLDNSHLLLEIDRMWADNPAILPSKINRCRILQYPGDYFRTRVRRARKLQNLPRFPEPTDFGDTSEAEKLLIRTMLKAKNVKNDRDVFTLELLEDMPLKTLHVILNENNDSGHCYFLPLLAKHIERRPYNPITNVPLNSTQINEIEVCMSKLLVDTQTEVRC